MNILTSDRAHTRTMNTLPRRIRIIATAGCSVLSAACGNTDNTVAPTARSLTGNWGSPHYSYASFALTETNGKVTGHGWVGVGSPVSVEGTVNGEDVALTLKPRVRNAVAPIAFRGELSNDALVGDIGYSGDASGDLTRVSMVRVDTVAESIGNLTFSNGARPVADNALFVWYGTDLAIFPARVLVEDASFVSSSKKFASGNLAPGKYSIGPSAVFQGRAYNHMATTGELTITRVASRMISGSFVMTVANGISTFDVSGTFSSSCPYDDLASNNARCSPPN